MKMTLDFVKMHGCGNDYIYFDCFDQKIEDPANLSRKLSKEHFGIGADGIILINPSKNADAEMRIFNKDGSEGKMCGNGIRCVGKYLYDSGRIRRSAVTVETGSGIKTLEITVQNGKAKYITVDMGKAVFDTKLIPVNTNEPELLNSRLSVNNIYYQVTCVSMGNPHCVIFCDDTDKAEIEKLGPLFENDPVFPDKVNTEFVEVIDRNTLKMRVWERGSGETLACGTGACASVSAAVKCGYCCKDAEINVILRGGKLSVRYTDEAVFMTGPAETVFTGKTEI